MSDSARQSYSARDLAGEARKILDAVVRIQQAGELPTLTAVRRAVQDVISLRLSEYISFLDRYGLLAFRRADGSVGLTDGGQGLIDGSGSDDLLGFVREHFSNLVAAEPEAGAGAVEEATEAEVAPAEDAAPEGGAEASSRQETSVSHQDRFERGEAIGTGGLAVAYAARQTALGRQVALKEFQDVFQYFTPDQRTVIEGRLRDIVQEHAGLSHPHIVRLIDFYEADGAPVIVLEFCAGGSLRDKLGGPDRLPVGLAVQYFLQIAEAVRYSHSRGVLHRNLKPENVLLDSQGNAQVADFGVTRIVERDDEHIRQVFVGVGTVAYLAPEQYQDSRNASVQSDIYSLGIMLYEMLTGKLPGRRSPMPSAYYDDVPAELDDVFDKMTMDFLDVRYESMDSVLKDLYGAADVLAVLPGAAPVLFTGFDDGVSAPAGRTRQEPDSYSAPVREREPEPEPEYEHADEPVAAAEAEAEPEPDDTSAPAGGGMSARLDDLAGDLFGDD